MPLDPGTYALGAQHGQLAVHTGKHGAAAKAGHNLLIEVGAWDATLTVAADPAQSTIALAADSRSLRVLEGTGGMQGLGDDDKANIAETIDKEVLKGTDIAFRSTAVRPIGDGAFSVSGELTLFGKGHPVTFDLTVDGRHLVGRATIKQTDWGMKPYSALFGTLKVNDEVEVTVEALLPDDG